MPSAFGNVAYKYLNGRGKQVFVPSNEGRKVGSEIKRAVEKRFAPDLFFYHLRDGGHVAAIHLHRSRRYFARIDIENFFYGVARNRVARALQELGISGGERYANWSTVKNPYAPPSYALPYGFIQSPLLATLVLARSPLGQHLRDLADKVTVSVYMDDIAISCNNKRVLERAFRKLRRKVPESNFTINEAKSIAPARQMALFNCQLEHLTTLVSEARRAEFYSEPRSDRSEAGFAAYCRSVEKGNGSPL
jgi:Reverse transcriptase (RNA-dependent DNA polymerase)